MNDSDDRFWSSIPRPGNADLSSLVFIIDDLFPPKRRTHYIVYVWTAFVCLFSYAVGVLAARLFWRK